MNSEYNNADSYLQLHNDKFYKRFDKQLATHSMIYVMASFGWGKTVFVQQYLNKYSTRSYHWINWDEDMSVTKELAEVSIRTPILVIDNFEHILHKQKQQKEVIKEFFRFIRTRLPKTKLILISSSRLPDSMLNYIVSGEMCLYNSNDLKLSKDEIDTFLKANGCILSTFELRKISVDFENRPLLIVFLMNRLREAQSGYQAKIKQGCLEDVFNYYDVNFFRRMDVIYQNYLLQLAYFDELSEELICSLFMITKERVKEAFRYISYIGNVFDMKHTGDNYVFEPVFALFLQRNAKKYIDEGKQKLIFKRAVKYYTDKKEFKSALKFAGMLGDEEQLVSILNLILPGHVANLDYLSLEPYLLQLSKTTIMHNPKMIAAMAMISCITLQNEEGQKWYRKLESLAEDADDSEWGCLVKSMFFYLRICMPGNRDDFTRDFSELADRYMGLTSNEVKSIIITSNMPSVLHGGRDFLPEIKKYQDHIETIICSMGETASKFMDNRVNGYFSLCMGELAYEKNHQIKALELVTKGLMESKACSNKEFIFAGTVIMGRILIARGQIQEAREYIDTEQITIQEGASELLMQNSMALYVEMNLISGDHEILDQWMAESAPDETGRFISLQRYQYLVKIRVYILFEEYFKAEYLINMMMTYAEMNSQIYLMIQLLSLSAAIDYRLKRDGWVEKMRRGIKMAEEVGFYRVIADEGVLVLPMLDKLSQIEDLRDDKFLKSLIRQAEKMGKTYSRYMKKHTEIAKLTVVEMEVLNFLEKGRKNQDIAKELCISENTVKYHLKNIFVKLGASSRSEAVNLAKENKVIN